MTNTDQQTDQTQANNLALISNNICRQLIAIQAVIDAREEALRYPTQQDIAMQCKLIGCLDKLRKLSGEKATSRSRGADGKGTNANKQTAAETAEVKAVKPPISELEFQLYKNLLDSDKDIREISSVSFRGRFVNCKWLHYNLLQYCLPPEERAFIHEEARVLAEVDYKATKEKVKLRMASLMAA